MLTADPSSRHGLTTSPMIRHDSANLSPDPCILRTFIRLLATSRESSFIYGAAAGRYWIKSTDKPKTSPLAGPLPAQPFSNSVLRRT